MSDDGQNNSTPADLNNFFYLSPEILCVINPEGYIQHISPAVKKMVGYMPEELIGKSIFHYCHPDDMVRTMKELSELAEGSRFDVIETRYQTKEGRYLWLAISAVLDKKTMAIYAIARDITSAKTELENLKKQAQKKNRFL